MNVRFWPLADAEGRPDSQPSRGPLGARRGAGRACAPRRTPASPRTAVGSTMPTPIPPRARPGCTMRRRRVPC